MKLTTPYRGDFVRCVGDAYVKIPEKSIQHTMFHSIRFNCADLETISKDKSNSNEMDTDTVVRDSEEEGTTNTHDLYIHAPTY
jgi:hypothetical protein